MTNYNSISNYKQKELNTEAVFRFTITVLLCVAITIVSFLAFLKIEGNIQAFSVFAIGMLINVVLCYSGLKQRLY